MLAAVLEAVADGVTRSAASRDESAARITESAIDPADDAVAEFLTGLASGLRGVTLYAVEAVGDAVGYAVAELLPGLLPGPLGVVAHGLSGLAHRAFGLCQATSDAFRVEADDAGEFAYDESHDSYLLRGCLGGGGAKCRAMRDSAERRP
ncbi:hypothetical protein ACFFKE_32450 [Streptomyces mutabilis]|uniref:hypothetical protein n=1 Tax=Streptomyces mutabilis TaxID=67332 RepID=UPI0035E73093